MPVESEHAPESLEPIRIREPPQNLFSAEFAREEDHDLARQRNHPLEKVARCSASVERQMGEAGAGHYFRCECSVRIVALRAKFIVPAAATDNMRDCEKCWASS